MSKRASANEVLYGQLYQRGQILSWPLSSKARLVEEFEIDLVVNFWAKVDPDMSDLVKGYMHFPVAPAVNMVDERIDQLAEYVATRILRGDCALILCEAGVTRSVYFTALVYRLVMKCSGMEAFEVVSSRVGKTRLRDQLLEKLKLLEKP